MAPNSGLIRYHGRLERILKDIALRLKLILTLEFFLRLAAVFIIILLGSLFVEELKGLFPYLPFAYSLLSLAILGWVLLQGLRRAAARLTLQRVARGLEEKIPRLKDDVTNSLLLFYQIRKKAVTDNMSEELVTAHLGKTVAAVSKIRPGQVLSYKKVLSHLKLVVPLGLAFVAVVVLDSQFLGRSTAAVFKPFTVLPLRETFITLEKAPAIVLRGTSLLIRARASGYIPERLSLKVCPEKGAEIRYAMTAAGNGSFSYRIASAQQSFQYQAVSDRAGSSEYPVRVVEAPEISDLGLTLIPPGYTGLPREVVTGGHIEALKGTVVPDGQPPKSRIVPPFRTRPRVDSQVSRLPTASTTMSAPLPLVRFRARSTRFSLAEFIVASTPNFSASRSLSGTTSHNVTCRAPLRRASCA